MCKRQLTIKLKLTTKEKGSNVCDFIEKLLEPYYEIDELELEYEEYL